MTYLPRRLFESSRPLCIKLSNNALKQLNQACVSALLSSHLRVNFQLSSYIKRTNRQLLGSTYQMLLNCSISGWYAHHGVISSYNLLVHSASTSSQTMVPTFTRDVFINLLNGPLNLTSLGIFKALTWSGLQGSLLRSSPPRQGKARHPSSAAPWIHLNLDRATPRPPFLDLRAIIRLINLFYFLFFESTKILVRKMHPAPCSRTIYSVHCSSLWSRNRPDTHSNGVLRT